jgi:hypothetical protein
MKIKEKGKRKVRWVGSRPEGATEGFSGLQNQPYVPLFPFSFFLGFHFTRNGHH